MRTLSLFRHAKSSWDNSVQADAERPLNARGRRAAPLMGRYIVAEGLIPDRLLCSSAVRTCETVERAFAGVTAMPSPEVLDALYLASAERIIDIVQKLPSSARHVMLVGHNPGLHDLALELLTGGDETADREGLRRLAAKLPTGSLVVLKLDVADWRALRPRSARLDRFVTPRDLEDAGD